MGLDVFTYGAAKKYAERYTDSKIKFEIGKFLSLWDCNNGMPISFPETTPYTYITGDYYIVGKIDEASKPFNLKPDGSSYSGIQSSVEETDTVNIQDIYVFDGTDWLLLTQSDSKLGQKMDKINPKGTGKIEIGENVTAYGEGSVAEGLSDNKATDVVSTGDISGVVTAANKSSRSNGDLETITEFIETWDHIPDGEEDPDQKFSLAAGDFSSVKGANGLALAKGADAEGNGTVAAGKSSHTEGTGSKAIGHYAHAGGLETTANTYGSFVHGRDVVANRRYSAVFGRGTKDADDYSETEASGTVVGALVFGKYNEPDGNGILIAGAGSNDDHRKTVHEVFKDGDKFSSWTEEDVTCGGSKNDPDVSLKQVDARLSGIILSNSQQVDSAMTGGLYRVAFSYNLGTGDSNWGELLSIPYASTDTQGAYYGAQLFFATGDESGKNCFWYRTCNKDTWNPWIKVDPSAYLQEDKIANFISLKSSTPGSNKVFMITVDDNGVLTATE